MALPTHISDDTRRLNPQIFGSLGPKADPASPITSVADAKKRIRQHQGDGMNGWEREYMAQLDLQWSHIYREVALPLANGLKFKVDFLVVSTTDPTRLVIEAHEVKGRALPTGIAKVKMAAMLYPWITFQLVTKKSKKDGGGWAIEEVLP